MKIGIYLSSRLLFRSWVSTGVYQLLKEQVDLTLYVTQHVYQANIDFCTTNNAIIVPDCPLETQYRHLHQAYLVGFRHKCITFNYVLERKILGNAYWKPFNLSGVKLWKHRINFTRDLFFTLRKNIFLYCNYFSVFRRLSITFLKRKLRNTEIIPSGLLSPNFDFFIIPSSADDPYLYGLIEQLRRNNIKSVLAIDNWDNLTSKSVFPYNPDYLTVMGPPCKKHAKAIHNIDHERIWVLGLPKFEIFREKQVPTFSAEVPVFNVLYLGFSLQHNEVKVLNDIYEALLGRRGENNFKLIYRPHPYALTRVATDERLNEAIELELVPDTDLILNGAPSYGESYFHSLKSADLVIGPPTTMLIEAMLMGKRCLVDSTDDQQHRTTSKVCHEKFLHIKDLSLIPELEFMDDSSNFGKFIDVDVDIRIPYSLDNIVNNLKESYANQLLREIRKNHCLKS
jgi:hypothetical protein